MRMAVSRRPIWMRSGDVTCSNPASTASTTSSRLQPLLEVQLRGEADLGVHDAVVGQVLGALAATRVSASGVCITPTVCWNGSR